MSTCDNGYQMPVVVTLCPETWHEKSGEKTARVTLWAQKKNKATFAGSPIFSQV